MLPFCHIDKSVTFMTKNGTYAPPGGNFEGNRDSITEEECFIWCKSIPDCIIGRYRKAASPTKSSCAYSTEVIPDSSIMHVTSSKVFHRMTQKIYRKYKIQ